MNKHRISYTSSAYSSFYSDNKNSSFRNYIDEQHLHYLPDGPLEAALVNLTFTLKERIVDRSIQLGIRSTLQKDSNIRGSSYDNIIYTFTILPSSKLTINYEIPPTQHIFQKTTKENLTRVKFEIIDLKTNNLFSEVDDSSQSTLIEISVQPNTMSSFSILFDSSDESSKNVFQTNNNMNFTTCLPERLELQSETWSVICKGVQTTGNIWNVQDQTFTLKFTKYFTKTTTVVSDWILKKEQKVYYDQYFTKQNGAVDMRQYKRESISIPAGSYQSIDQILNILNRSFFQAGLVFLKFVRKSNKTRLLSRFKFDDENYIKEKSAVTLMIPAELARILEYEKHDSVSQQTVKFNILSSNTDNWISSYNNERSVVEEEMDTSTFQEVSIILVPGLYKTRQDVVQFLNSELKTHKIDVTFQANYSTTRLTSKFVFDENAGYTRDKSTVNLSLSSNLARMLGFTINNQPVNIDLLTTPNTISTFDENLNIGLPSTILVNMNIVQTRVVGNKHLPVIQTLHITRTRPSILHFVVRENNAVLLNTKLFYQVNIRITDINGNDVKADNDYPTIIHLGFIRWDV